MNLSPVLRQRYFDANGLPLAGGLLYSYAAGTTTPQGTYSNSTGTTNANPVVLDANGYADVWIDPSLAYKFILQDSGANVLWSVDNVSFPTGISTWSINTSYSQGQLVADSSGQGLLYVSLTNSNQGNALTSVANWRIFGGNVTSVSVNTTLTVTHELVRSNSTSGALTHTLPACSTTPIGKKITVKDVGTGGFTTTIKGSGADTIDGNNTFAYPLFQYTSYTFINNGTSWDSNSLSGTISARYTNSGAQVVAASTTTIVTGWTKDYDSRGIFNLTSGVGTIPAGMGGKYRIRAFLAWSTLQSWTSGQEAYVRLYKNAAQVSELGHWYAQASVTLGPRIGGDDTITFAAGDTFDVRVFQSTAGNVSMSGSSVVNYLTITKVAD